MIEVYLRNGILIRFDESENSLSNRPPSSIINGYIHGAAPVLGREGKTNMEIPLKLKGNSRTSQRFSGLYVNGAIGWWRWFAAI